MQFNSRQQIFDHVAQHLRKQGERCVDERVGRCLYRNPDGLKCAVGACISDEEYDPAMDSPNVTYGVLDLIETFPALQHLMPYKGLLSDLQEVHDEHLAESPIAMERQLFEVAVDHNLKYTYSPNGE